MKHLSDAELLLLESTDETVNRTNRKPRHFDECATCKARLMELAATMHQFESAHAMHAASVDPSLSGARARLSLAMQEARMAKPFSVRSNIVRRLALRLVFPGAAAVLVVLAFHFIPGLDNATGQFLRPWKTATLPSKSLTPGATKTVVLSSLCGAQGSTARMPIDDAVAKRVFQEYGLSYASRSSYEVDYLITPGLGGSSDVRNLWPEPEAATGWNARVKDALEDHLHDLVCEGKLPLATAQSEISNDWIAAYKRHFHTDKPRRS